MNLLAFYFRYVCLLVLFSVTQITYAAPDWSIVDKLVREQKFTEAYKRIDAYVKDARRSKDNDNWQQALILGTVLRNHRNEHENAVNYLTNQPWPADDESQMLVNLHLAHVISDYIKRYRWEIQNREKVSSKGKIPLKKKTMKQLVGEVNRAFAKAYLYSVKQDVSLDSFTLQLPSIKQYFVLPDYPPEVRGKLRDTVTYLWVDFLVDSSLWDTQQSNKGNGFGLNELLAISYQDKLDIDGDDIHPFKRLMWLLSDLEHYQIRQNKPEGAMEAFRVKVEKLSQFMSGPAETKQLIEILKKRIANNSASFPELPWVNMLRATLADIMHKRHSAESNIQSVAVLKQCLAVHKNHRATSFCQQKLDEITQPSFSLSSMKSDGLNKRSFLLNHANMDKVYFRAWKMTLPEVMKNKSRDQMKSLLKKKGRKPDVEWQENLIASKDYMQHKTYVVPSLKQYGFWFVAASTRADFSMDEKENQIETTTLNLTRLVADVQSGGSQQEGSKLDVTVYNGETGHIASNVKVELWTEGYNKPSRFISAQFTSNQGKVSFKVSQNKQYKLVLRYEDNFTLVDRIYQAYTHGFNQNTKKALVFTDRAIYRPAQKIQWKVVAYKGKPDTGKYTVFPNTQGWVKLLDANHKVVKQINVKTNQYGSASGEFTAKTGLLLGWWRIETSWGGNRSIKVEEYKRPTFSVKIDDTKKSLGLDKPAEVTGSSKYYFGQAVSDGKVKWRVKRMPLYLWEYGGRGRLNETTIATGDSELDEKGQFKVRFVPKTPSADQVQGLRKLPQQYTFQLSADITDAGGETRTVTRGFNIGNVGIKANISAQQTFGITGKSYQLSVGRHDLDSIPRAGNAYWELFRVDQPDKPKMPADLPVKAPVNEHTDKFKTRGDDISPRWAAMAVMDGYIADWKDAEKIQQGALKHDEDGNAKIDLKGLAAGLYRLRYTSKDQWGQAFKTHKSFVIADKNKKTIQIPALLMSQEGSVEVGENINLLMGSAFSQSPVLLEIYQGSKLLKRSIQKGGIRQFDFPVNRGHRGGLTFVTTLVKDYQLIRKEQFVSVPWTDKNLNVSFSTFRDKLQPGQKEKWRVTVKDSENKPLEKGAAEVLASMYDRSLDLFTPHNPANVSRLYSQQRVHFNRSNSLGRGSNLYSKRYSLGRSANLYFASSLNLMQPLLWQTDNSVGAKSGFHNHRAIPGCTSSIRHNHKYKSASHKHQYACRGMQRAELGHQMMEAAPVVAAAPAPAMAPRPQVDVYALQRKLKAKSYYTGPIDGVVGANTRAALQRFMDRGKGGNQIADGLDGLDTIETRTNFNETAFFYPHLVLDENGSVAFEFEVPESLTQWKVWVSAITKDLRGGSVTETAQTSKELMVRPYLPRFLRAGDSAHIEVLVNNAGEKALKGKLDFDVLDAKTEKSIAADFKLADQIRNFEVAAGQSSRLRFSVVAPKDLGMVAIRARASATNGTETFGDGEQRPLPVLPSRIHLSQSRFAALHGNTSKQLQFKQLAESYLAKNQDTSRINEKLVVTVDGQLFYSTLKALPYLVDYPYECTEQTMNRFLSTSIVNSVFDKHPAIASMAKQMTQRDTAYEQWDTVDKDQNRKMLLEETPWLAQAQGNTKDKHKLIRILDPKVAKKQYQKALKRLQKAQTASGGFPWWEGGRESVYMTTYLLHGFSRALEFNIEIPKDMVQKAWAYLDKHYETNLKPAHQKKTNQKKMHKGNLHEITLINYVLSAYPDESWTGKAFSAEDRKIMLDYSFKHWGELSPLIKAYLTLTLKRAGREQQAKLVFDSIMDAAKKDDDLGTYWSPEDRSWLWYNDTIDTHAFILRTMMELNPDDKRRHGLVQWLLLNKKLSHWKSTRATAESIYSLVHYLKQEDQLSSEERATIKVGNQLSKTLVFKPDEYTGTKNQLVVEAKKIKPDMANINIANQGKSLMFASASWHFSTEKLPESAEGDFFNVKRSFFKRVQKGKEWELQPLAEGASVAVGDQLEVQLSLRAKHSAEYVHLRAPRGAGFEPVKNTSGYRWQTGLGYYEEIRDSGANYFFEHLPVGEFTFKYRLRATTAGQFRVAPATVQSIYAPEFNAYSSGIRLQIN